MSDPPVEWHRGERIVSTGHSRIDQNAALALLRTTFWATGMDPAVLARATANSVCFGVTTEGPGGIGPGPLIYMEHRSS